MREGTVARPLTQVSATQTATLQNDAAIGADDDPLLDCLVAVTRLHGSPVSAEALSAGLPLEAGRLTPSVLLRAAARQGFAARIVKRPLKRISNLALPAILLLADGNACLLTRINPGGTVDLVMPESGFGARTLPVDDLQARYAGYAIFVHPLARPDTRLGDAAPTSGHWFWSTLWRFKRYYAEALLSTALINLLTLGSALFIMNVYDRVVPNNAIDTLNVLAIGVIMAMGFEFLARNLRGYFIDTSGKKADLLLAEKLFRHALGLRMEARPASSGAFAAQLREFESLRDFCSSATIASFSDLPFVLFFVWVIFLIGGPLYIVPLMAVPLVLGVGLLAQIPLARLMRRHVAETALKHAIVVEAVEGMDTLKTLCAEGVMQGRFENYVALTGNSAVKSRMLSSAVVHFAQLVTQLVTVLAVVWGVYLIGDGELSMGALIAVVILSGRGLAPLSQLAGLLVRYQHARAAYFMLDDLMNQPVERPPGRSFLHRENVRGDIELRNVSFAYPANKASALSEVSFRVGAGERVGILGRVGSGKSTLLKLLVGLYRPQHGAVMLDGADIEQFDPGDLRKHVGYLGQDVRLFHGSLRENISLGTPHADDEAILAAARIAGLEPMVARHPMGFDQPVGEGGTGLSGGQRQAVGLARTLLTQPRVLLLDEPTSSMDHTTEQAFIANLLRYAEGRTLFVVTHKPSILGLVDRLIVVEEGRVVADGPRDAVLRALTQNANAPKPAAPQAGTP